MAPFIRKKSGGPSTAPSTGGKAVPPGGSESATPEAAPSLKKSSKMKRLLTRRKKNGLSSVIVPGVSRRGGVGPAATNYPPPTAREGDADDTEYHANKSHQGGGQMRRTSAADVSAGSPVHPLPEMPMLSLEEVATLLRSDLEIRDRKYHLKTYPQCFVGSEAVDYLVESGICLDRGSATSLGREVMKLGAFERVEQGCGAEDTYSFAMTTLGAYEHVTKEHDFEDKYLFYHFKESFPLYKNIGTGDSQGSSTGAGVGGGSSTGIVKMDKYGFLLEDNSWCADKGGSAASVGSRDDVGGGDSIGDSSLAWSKTSDAKRWEAILGKVPMSKAFNGTNSNLSYSSTQSKVKYYARRGLPDGLRRKAWTVLTGVDLIMNENPGEYDALVDKAEEEWNKMHDLESAGDLSASCEGFNGQKSIVSETSVSRGGIVLETIERDIHRTFPKHYLFHTVNDLDGSTSNQSGTLYDSEALGSDDEGEDNSTAADADEIATIAESMGQDPSLVVEEKKQLYSESMNSSLMDMNHVSCGGLHSLGGNRLARIPDGSFHGEGDSDCDGDDTKSRRPSLNDVGRGKSDESLDIYSEEEDNDPKPRETAWRRDSATSCSSEAMGMGGGQNALRRVLRAYSIYDSEVGYCQGMNFIAAMFLTFVSEEEAFWLLVVTMNEEPYKLRELFGEDMAGTHEVLYIAEKLLAQFLPKLSKHLEQETVHVSMFVTQWLLTVYTSIFPFDLVARVWDCFLVEGWKVVYRVMLSLLEHASEDIMNCRFEDILHYFRDYPSTVNGYIIMASSLKIALKRKHIQKHVNEWRRHASGGEERFKPTRSKPKRGPTSDSSVSSNTMNSLGHETAFPKLAPPKNLLKKTPKEIIVENLTEQLLPIIGTSKFAVILHNFLTPEECSELIDRAEEGEFEDGSIYDRRTNQQHRKCTRHVFDDQSLADNWYERIAHALTGTIFERKLANAPWAEARNAGKILRSVGVNERLRLLRYKQGEFFHTHNDATFVRSHNDGERAGETSLVSVQVYLNQKFKGGCTTFVGRGRHLDVKPRTGSVLLFEHGILHEGQKVTQGKKYLVRTDIMYSVASAVGFASSALGTSLTQQL